VYFIFETLAKTHFGEPRRKLDMLNVFCLAVLPNIQTIPLPLLFITLRFGISQSQTF
jgi:hypothetical protein